MHDPTKIDRNIKLEKHAFWKAGKSYEDSTRTVENPVATNSDGLLLGEVIETDGGVQKTYISNFWVSCPIDLTVYNIESLKYSIDSSTTPSGKQTRIYISHGSTSSEANSGTLTLVQDKHSLESLGITGKKWLVFAIELI